MCCLQQEEKHKAALCAVPGEAQALLHVVGPTNKRTERSLDGAVMEQSVCFLYEKATEQTKTWKNSNTPSPVQQPQAELLVLLPGASPPGAEDRHSSTSVRSFAHGLRICSSLTAVVIHVLSHRERWIHRLGTRHACGRHLYYVLFRTLLSSLSPRAAKDGGHLLHGQLAATWTILAFSAHIAT